MVTKTLATSSYRSQLAALLKRDLKVALRRRSDVIHPLLFLFMVISLFPVAIGPGPDILARIAPGVIWVAALLASLLGLERLFRDDYQDGTLEQLVLLPCPLPLAVLAKILVHWLLTGLPLVLIAPLLALLLNLPLNALPVLLITLLLGTPVLSAVGAVGAALTVSLQRGGAVLSLLVLPLFIPLLIFATAAVESAVFGAPVLGQLLLLASFSILTLTLMPFAVAAAVKVSVN